MESRRVKLFSTRDNRLGLYMIPGHFTTCSSHINAYIDLNYLKTRMSEAREVAKNLAAGYKRLSDVVDTIVCMDGTDVIGTLMAEEFEKQGFFTNNAHNSIYVVSPEENIRLQMMFRDNNVAAVKGRHVLLLFSAITTGESAKNAVNAIRYYGGIVQGIASIFSTVQTVDGIDVNSVFTDEDVPGYSTYSLKDCPFCKQGTPLEAMVNSYGYTKY